MVPNKWFSQVAYDINSDAIQVHLVQHHRFDGSAVYWTGGNMVIRERGSTEAYPGPLLSIDSNDGVASEMLQALFDTLWEYGFRPEKPEPPQGRDAALGTVLDAAQKILKGEG